MKSMSASLSKQTVTLLDDSNKLVHFYTSAKGYVEIDPPVWAREFSCPFCGETKFYLFTLKDQKSAWVCGRVCEASKLPKLNQATITLPNPKRELLWPLFCEINGIGDVHHDVRFENIQQAQGKIDYMLKFATAPRGIIFMRGDPGTGKTYASMAICEFFTRKCKYCIFTTQKKMAHNWLMAQGDNQNKYISNVSNIPLLVIDDFGTGEPTAKFLEFFMELINDRLQWKNRGTIITTNLDVNKFNLFCGENLADRIMTGQIFNFEGKTRRKKVEL